MFKKTLTFIGIVLISAIPCLGIEWLLYSLINTVLFYVFGILSLLILVLFIENLDRLGFFNKYINPIIVLCAVFCGLGLLKLLLPVLL